MEFYFRSVIGLRAFTFSMKIHQPSAVRADALRVLFASSRDVGSAQALVAWPHGTRRAQPAAISCREARRRTSETVRVARLVKAH